MKSITQFCLSNGISRSSAYKEIKAGRLVATKVGRRTLIKPEAEQAWRDSCPPLIPSPPIQPNPPGDEANPHNKPGRLRLACCHACGRDLINCKEVDHV